jgi:hypothetical protein
VNTETISTQDAIRTEPTHRWADDGGVLTEAGQPAPESMEPESMKPESMKPEMPMAATANPVVGEPLLSDEAEQAFLSRWAEIQSGFVEDPEESVRDADRLLDEIAAAQLSSFQARRTDLAVDWQQGSPGTEQLRLALRRYRDFVGVILAK